MDIEDETGFAGFIDNVKRNPVLLGLVGVVVLIAIYFIHKQISGGTNAAKPAVDTANPAVPIVYNNTYNSYPTVVPPPPGSPPTTPPVHIPTPVGPPVPIKNPPKPTPRYYTTTTWPAPGSSLWTIAEINHESLAQIEALNPQIKNPNLIYPGQQIRIS